ncbi:MAG: hypothetical protein AAGA48_10095 [Myxococcota bacterium]
MSSGLPNLNPVIDGLIGRKLPNSVHYGSLAAMAVGVVAFFAGVVVLGKPAYTWGAYLVGLVYTLAIAQGGVIFAILMTGTTGRWGRPVKRIGEAFGFFLPVGWLLLAVFLVFGIYVYSWHPETIIEGGQVDLAPHSAEAAASKEYWLAPGFFTARQLAFLGILIVLDGLYIYQSLRPDLVMARQRLGNKAPAIWETFTRGSGDLATTVRESLRGQALLTPFIGLAYALVFSFVGFDLIMSLSPWWFSNMFGGFIFMSSFWLALAALGAVAVAARDWLRLGPFVTSNVTHDIGKLMLAGCMFWAYTTYAQLLPIWYTDMPEETEFLLVRMRHPDWEWLAMMVGVTCFLAPFTILVSRGIKKMRWPFFGICLLVMVGLFLERSLLVLPSVYFESALATDTILISIGVWVGFMGLFIQVVGQVLCRIPPLVISDPYLEPHPWDVHVHSLDHRA